MMTPQTFQFIVSMLLEYRARVQLPSPGPLRVSVIDRGDQCGVQVDMSACKADSQNGL